MPSYILKPKPDEDYYVRYSTIVDSPTGGGTRAEMLTLDDVTPERLDRADDRGTSVHYGLPPFYGWHEDRIQVREGVTDPTRPSPWHYGSIARADLRTFCESLQDDGNFHPSPGLITWTTDDTDIPAATPIALAAAQPEPEHRS
ncbi:hypothetical protein [Microbacterium sp.]|jgi:hypothetical protein|uniref:hypothetical protein n=1 Tax=Microbacterium sp. TaxID=51671 RepID=UPI0037C7C884